MAVTASSAAWLIKSVMAIEAMVALSLTASQPELDGVSALVEAELSCAASDVPWSATPSAAENPTLLS